MSLQTLAHAATIVSCVAALISLSLVIATFIRERRRR
jgi:hypothetical protein